MKMLTQLLFLLLFSIAATSQSFQSRFEKIDSIAQKLPAAESKTIAQLGNFINSNFNNDLEKSRFIYAWIATHIRYDIDCFLGKNSNLQDAETVFRFRQGVCAGYANLFDELCNRCHLTSFKVDGTSSKINQSDHVWNVVNIDGKWRLIDVTWGAGGVNQSQQFIPQYDDQYFDSPPEIFIREHLPGDPMWQLLYQPVSFKDFSEENFNRNVPAQANTFYFNDTIRTFLSLDSAAREFDSFRRSYTFNPENGYLTEGRIVTLMAQGETPLQKGDDWFNSYFKIKEYAFQQSVYFDQNEARIKVLLDSADISYAHTKKMYDLLPSPRESINSEAIKINQQLIEERINYLKTEEQFVREYFSASASARKQILQLYPLLVAF